jgi:hypothetical protein
MTDLTAETEFYEWLAARPSPIDQAFGPRATGQLLLHPARSACAVPAISVARNMKDREAPRVQLMSHALTGVTFIPIISG